MTNDKKNWHSRIKSNQIKSNQIKSNQNKIKQTIRHDHTNKQFRLEQATTPHGGVRARVCVCVCVCVRERERERDRE